MNSMNLYTASVLTVVFVFGPVAASASAAAAPVAAYHIGAFVDGPYRASDLTPPNLNGLLVVDAVAPDWPADWLD